MFPRDVAESTKAGMRNAYEAVQGPFAESDVRSDFIVIRTSDFDGELSLSDAEKASLLAGYDDYLKGRVVDVRELIASMRSKHGLWGGGSQGCGREL